MRAKIAAAGLAAAVLALAQPAAAEGKRTIGLLWHTTQIPVVVAMLDKAKERAKQLGYDTVVVDAGDDVAKELAGMETLLQQDVAAVVLHPVESSGSVAAVKRANQAGVPVVTLDGNVNEGKVFTYIGSDNFRAGELDGEYLVRRLGGKGQVVVLHYNILEPGWDRYNGFLNVLKSYPDIKIIASGQAGYLEKGLSLMSDYLQANDKIDAVWCVNDPSCLGAIRAIRAAGREKEMFLVATDGEPEAIREIDKGGAYAMTSVQFPVELAYKAVESAAGAIEGKSPVSNYEPVGVKSPMPKFYAPVFAVTKDSLSRYKGWYEGAPKDLSPPWWKPATGGTN
jgi:ribose transport system substrate-binding protein